MNERIRELAEQAVVFASRTFKVDTDSWKLAYNAKFAELIVKECAKACADQGMRSGGGCTTTGEVYLQASKLVRTQFGMETWGLY